MRLAIAIMLVLGACGDGGQPSPDAGSSDARLRGPAPFGCEETKAHQSECQSYESICTPSSCGGWWECCYEDVDEDGNETWGTLFTHCEMCPDAGVPDAAQ